MRNITQFKTIIATMLTMSMSIFATDQSEKEIIEHKAKRICIRKDKTSFITKTIKEKKQETIDNEKELLRAAGSTEHIADLHAAARSAIKQIK